jgi:hypothetical protein
MRDDDFHMCLPNYRGVQVPTLTTIVQHDSTFPLKSEARESCQQLSCLSGRPVGQSVSRSGIAAHSATAAAPYVCWSVAQHR